MATRKRARTSSPAPTTRKKPRSSAKTNSRGPSENRPPEDDGNDVRMVEILVGEDPDISDEDDQGDNEGNGEGNKGKKKGEKKESDWIPDKEYQPAVQGQKDERLLDIGFTHRFSRQRSQYEYTRIKPRSAIDWGNATQIRQINRWSAQIYNRKGLGTRTVDPWHEHELMWIELYLAYLVHLAKNGRISHDPGHGKVCGVFNRYFVGRILDGGKEKQEARTESSFSSQFSRISGTEKSFKTALQVIIGGRNGAFVPRDNTSTPEFTEHAFHLYFERREDLDVPPIKEKRTIFKADTEKWEAFWRDVESTHATSAKPSSRLRLKLKNPAGTLRQHNISSPTDAWEAAGKPLNNDKEPTATNGPRRSQTSRLRVAAMQMVPPSRAPVPSPEHRIPVVELTRDTRTRKRDQDTAEEGLPNTRAARIQKDEVETLRVQPNQEGLSTETMGLHSSNFQSQKPTRKPPSARNLGAPGALGTSPEPENEARPGQVQRPPHSLFSISSIPDYDDGILNYRGSQLQVETETKGPSSKRNPIIEPVAESIAEPFSRPERNGGQARKTYGFETFATFHGSGPGIYDDQNRYIEEKKKGKRENPKMDLPMPKTCYYISHESEARIALVPSSRLTYSQRRARAYSEQYRKLTVATAGVSSRVRA